MRGLQERRNAGVKYLAIKEHRICEDSKRERDGFVEVTRKDPQDNPITKYVKYYDRVEALIKKVEWSDREWDGRPYQSWRIHLDADGTPCVLDLPFSSRASTRFMKLAENIDYARPVEFAAWQSNDGSQAFFVGQRDSDDDEKAATVPQLYTKDNPGDCPPPKQRMGGAKLDFSDQNEWLYDRMTTVVIPMVEAAQRNGHAPAESYNDESESQGQTREELIDQISGICRDLNTSGDKTKWGKASLNTFINDTYEVTDGLDSLTPDYLSKLANLLQHRLSELEDVPF